MIAGAKVVCVNDVFAPEIARFYRVLTKKDVIYVVRDVVLGVNDRGEPGEVCLYLVGLNNPHSDKPPYPERGFNAERFRLLETLTEREQAAAGRPDEAPLISTDGDLLTGGVR